VGSIGILWGKFVLKGLHAKLGLTTETVKTTPHADANSLSRAWDSAEVAALQRHMDAFYDRFLDRVAAGRGMSREKADSLAQGRIFTGTQSVAAGLVDRIGGLEEAVAEAARLAGIPQDRRVDLELVPGRQGRSRLGGGWAFATFDASPEDLGEAGLATASAWAERWLGRAEGQLWAMSPELSGWGGTAPE
jgi:protease-4